MVLDTLATLILRIRDRRFEAIEQKGSLVDLTEEIVQAVAYSNYRSQLEVQTKATSPPGETGSGYQPVVPSSVSVSSSWNYHRLEKEEREGHRQMVGKILVNEKIRLMSSVD